MSGSHLTLEMITEPKGCALHLGLWCVHAVGPDDIFAMPDYKTAVRYAAIMNTTITSNDDVLYVAVPSAWMDCEESHQRNLRMQARDIERLDFLEEAARQRYDSAPIEEPRS